MIYNRNTYRSENLEESDFLHGIGFDTSLLIQYLNIRRTEKDTTHDYYHKDGMSIDGTIRVEKYHPLQNKILYDKEDNNKEVIIESIHKHWHWGYYWCAVYRMIGSKSHGTLYFKNESSIDSTILESIDHAHKNYVFKDGSKWE